MKDALTYPKSLIVLAEDDEDFFIITRYALEQAGFAGKLDLVNNYRALMGYLQEREKPSLIILDLKTAPEDWHAALKELKAHKRYRSIPVVVLSASDQPEDIEFCERYRGCSYIEKPLTFDEWRACMENLIRTNLEALSK